MEHLHHQNNFVSAKTSGHDLKENTHSEEMKNAKGHSAVIKQRNKVITEEDAERAVVVVDHLVVDYALHGCQESPYVSDEETEKNGVQGIMVEEPALNSVKQNPEMKSNYEILEVVGTESSSTPENLEIKETETDVIQALDLVRNRGSTIMSRLNVPTSRESSSNGCRKNILLPWQEAAIEKAIEDCNKGMRVSQAARCHNVADSTLRSRLKKVSPGIVKTATPQIWQIGRKRGPVQEDAVRKAVKDYDQGSSLMGAANRYDVPVSTVYDRLKSEPRRGTLNQTTGRGSPALENAIRKAIRDYARGCTVRAAAARHGVSDTTIHYRLKKRLATGATSRSEQIGDVHNRRTRGEKASSINAGKQLRISRSEAIQDVQSIESPQGASNMQKTSAEVKRGESLKSAGEKHGIPQSTLHDRVYGRSKRSSAYSTRNASLNSTQKRKSLSPVGPSPHPWSEDDIQKAIEDVDRGLHMSRVAVMYNIPDSTLLDRLKKRENDKGTLSKTRRSGKSTKGFGTNTVSVRRGALVQSTLPSKLKKIGPRYGKSTSRHSRNPRWSEKDVLRAIKDVKKGLPVSRAARVTGIPSGTLNTRKKKIERMSRKVQKDQALDFPLVNDRSVRRLSGRQQLVQYINKLGSFGFIPRNNDELLEAVKDFVASKDVCIFSGNFVLDGDWLSGFLAQNDSVMKMSRLMDSCQKTKPGSSNPFVVYNFYDTLEQISSEKSLESNQIWTCCEAGFPNNPRKVGVRVRFDVGAENSTTCLIACGGAGQVLDPFIIYPEKLDRGSVVHPGMSYAVSDNGCMTAAVFDNWFRSFTTLVKQRPLLLIVDSRLTYLSDRTIQKAASEHIFLMKIPCNTSNVLQPLWQFCFAQFALKWKTASAEWLENHDNDEQMSKADFAEQLYSVWHECLSQEDIAAGFESTGIFPVNRTQFPVNKLDKGLQRLHNVWLGAGKPEHMAPDIPAFFNPTVTAPSLPSARATRSASQPVPLNFDEDYNQEEEEVSPRGPAQTASGDASTPPDSASVVPVSVCWCRSPPVPVPGKKWVPTWTLLDDVDASSSSFELDSSC